MEQRDKYSRQARMTGYALNAAIGLQVLFGSLTTGLSAVATSGKSVRLFLATKQERADQIIFPGCGTNDDPRCLFFSRFNRITTLTSD